MDYDKQRRRMVDEQIAERGIDDARVLAAMASVEREKFIPPDLRDLAYQDGPLPIGCGQTISQPYMVALMTQALRLKGGEKVLEIGTGSGYAAAVLGEIAGEVVTIERKQELADRAREKLTEMGYANIHVIAGDGTRGCAEKAPFDAIVVTAGGPLVPQSLRDQLKVGGRLVIPVGSEETFQTLIRITRRTEDEYDEERLCLVRFIPLIGAEGWHHNHYDDWSDPDYANLR